MVYVTPSGATDSTKYTLTSNSSINVPENAAVSWIIVPGPTNVLPSAPNTNPNLFAFDVVEDVLTSYSYDGVTQNTPCWRKTVEAGNLASMNANHNVVVEFDGYPGTTSGTQACPAYPPIIGGNMSPCQWTRGSTCDSSRIRSHFGFANGAGAQQGNWKIYVHGSVSYPEGFRLEVSSTGGGCGSTYKIPSSASDSRYSGSSFISDYSELWGRTTSGQTFTVCSTCTAASENVYVYVLPDPNCSVSSGNTSRYSYYIQDPADACGSLAIGTITYKVGGSNVEDRFYTYNNDPFKNANCCSVSCNNPI